MNRASELLKQPYAMKRDSLTPSSPYAAGLQTGQTTGRTSPGAAATAPVAPAPARQRTAAEINYDITQLQKKRNAMMEIGAF